MQPRILFDFLMPKGTLLAHVQLGVHEDPDVLFCYAAFQLGGLQHVLVPGVVPPQGQDLAFHITGKTIQLGRYNPGGSYRASMITF